MVQRVPAKIHCCWSFSIDYTLSRNIYQFMIVLGRLTENRIETAVLKKPTTERLQFFYTERKADKTDTSFFPASMLT